MRPGLGRGGLKTPIIHHSYSFDEALTKYPASSLVESLRRHQPDVAEVFPEICVTNVMGDEIKLFFSPEPMDESS